MQLVFNIILLVSAVFLIVAVLMQSGKSHNLSGTIAGGAETFFGKTKGKTIDKMLSKLTTIVAIVFVLLVILVYVIQPDTLFDPDKSFEDNFDNAQTEVTNPTDDKTADTAAPTVDDADDAVDAAE